MVFTIFLIIAAWQLPLPQWLQICLTVFGALHILFDTGETIIYKNKDD